MARLCADRTGLFPPPSSIRFTCSCPDYAIMCKHVAAVMYGVGARFDHAPELLFTLRRVSADELLAAAVTDFFGVRPAPASARVLVVDGLAAMFGIELVGAAAEQPEPPPKPARRKSAGRTKVAKAAPAKRTRAKHRTKRKARRRSK
jgi:uncharacterized Zn finger protein